MAFYPPSSWLIDACAALGQTPDGISAYLADRGLPNVVGTVEEVERVCRETPLRPMVLGWPMNRDWDDKMLIRRTEAHGPDVIATVLAMSPPPQLLAIVIPPKES